MKVVLWRIVQYVSLMSKFSVFGVLMDRKGYFPSRQSLRLLLLTVEGVSMALIIVRPCWPVGSFSLILQVVSLNLLDILHVRRGFWSRMA